MTTKITHLVWISLATLFLTQPILAAQPRSNAALSSQYDHPEVPRISAFKARVLFDQGRLILANAHVANTYARKHILGSISIANDMDKSRMKLPRNVIIAFY